MKKILVCGESCSGKTTFGKYLSSKLKINHYDLDEIHWLPGWNISSDEVFENKLNTIVKKEQWIITGNYFSRQDSVINYCDTVIYLKIGFITRLYRAFIRGIARSITKNEVCNGNYETFGRNFFSKDSLLLYIIKTRKIFDKKIQNIKSMYADKSWIILSSSKAIKNYESNFS